MRKGLAATIAILAWFGLALQFEFAVTNPATLDVSLLERTVRYFSFFTIVSNLIVAVITTAIGFFPNSRPGRFVNNSSMLTAAAVYITIVAVVYSLFLRAVVNAQGLHAISDHIVHDIVPPAFVIYWAVYAPKAGITWLDPVKWLIVPVFYIAYSLAHGAFDNWYPYWFADVRKLGYPTALRNSGFVLLAFLVFGFVYAVIAKLLSRSANSAST